MDKDFEENVYGLVAGLEDFEYRISNSDKIWDIIFPHQMGRRTVYHRIVVTQYQEAFYIHHYDGKLSSLEVQMNKSIQSAPSWGSSHTTTLDFEKGWSKLISSVNHWLMVVKKDWI